MPMPEQGHKAPAFTLPISEKKSVSLADFRGSKLVLYFYPKGDTPGCTQEACDFRDNLKAFDKLKAHVLGVSRDSLKNHEKFSKKYDLNFPLGSDETGDVCERYGVWVEKSMYGKKYMGIERTTFLIGEEGTIERVWQKVRVADHIDEIVKALGSSGSQKVA